MKTTGYYLIHLLLPHPDISRHGIRISSPKMISVDMDVWYGTRYIPWAYRIGDKSHSCLRADRRG